MKKVIGILLTTVGIVAAVFSIILKVKGHMSVSIIGGADGPTSIFLAGKVGNTSAVLGVIVGIILFAAGIFMIARRK